MIFFQATGLKNKSEHKTRRFESERKPMSVETTNVEQMMLDGSILVTNTDLKSKITYLNRPFIEISGYTADELMGKAHSIVRHPDMPRSAFFDLWETLEAGAPWKGLVKNRTKNGDYYWVEANVAPLYENGNHTGYLSVRKKASRDKIRQAENLYRDVMDGRKPFPRTLRSRIKISTLFNLYLVSITALCAGAGAFLFSLDPGIFPVALLSAIALLSVSGGFWLKNYVLKPVKEAARIASKIGSGDLTVDIVHDRNDEIGDLYKAILSMLINMTGLIGKIKENSVVLSDSARELTQASMSLSAGIEESSVQSQGIAASALQMNQNLQTISSSTEEMSISISDVARNAAEAAKIASNANKNAENTQGIVRQLGTGAVEIGKVIESISTIAAQTNLLALNAAIEAASAGDAGKGFAVVAAEVKELARQSAHASEEIKTKIQAMQSSTSQAVEAITTIGGVIRQVHEINGSIAAAVEEQSIATREIASNVAQSTGASNEVTRNIEGISTASKMGAKDAVKTSTMASDLLEMSSQLSSMISKFSV